MKKIIFPSLLALFAVSASAQSAVDAYRISQPDLKGTARYMSMAGAFGALGGDLSVLSHNPGGIGIYRSSEVGFTLDLDLQHAESNSDGFSTSINQTKFLLNNIGFVWTLKLNNSSCPNLNFGFTYNKTASFNRRYRGAIGLTNSLSNYMAALTNKGGYVEGQLVGDEFNDWDPYNPTYADDAAPWLSILGYDAFLFTIDRYNPSTGDTHYVGQWTPGMTSGTGYFDVRESGGIDSYNIALGGNISNVFFWGLDFDITHLNYNLNPTWTENLQNALVEDQDGVLRRQPALWTLNNYYNCSGNGFNFKLGFIVKPIQEFRVGFSFETPTWYSLTETFNADINALYNGSRSVSAASNDGWPGYNDVSFRSPWKINLSAATVLFNRLIVSAEYEWAQYKEMKYSAPSYWGGGDYWFDDNWWGPYGPIDNFDPFISSDPFDVTNRYIREIYRNTNTFRLGAEFRLIPQLSLRAGYSYVSSPVKSTVNDMMIQTAGTLPNYRMDNSTNYVTAGLGTRFGNFYVDLAYVFKHMTSVYHPFSPFFQEQTASQEAVYIPVQKSSLSLDNSQIVLSAGFKF